MARTKEPPQTWTPEQVANQERALEARVSVAQRELDRVKKWHQAELRELRKFRRDKIRYAAQIVPASVVSSTHRGGE